MEQGLRVGGTPEKCIKTSQQKSPVDSQLKTNNTHSLPTIGALWIGGSLTWLEQLCLKSFLAHGHEVILFTYGEVRNVPEGVKIQNGREIIDTEEFLLHGRTQSVALFSDLFRFHMIKKIPEIIYIDTDVYCLKPLDFSDPRKLENTNIPKHLTCFIPYRSRNDRFCSRGLQKHVHSLPNEAQPYTCGLR